MKKFFILLASLLSLTACNQENNGIYADEIVTRWENEEVVCYIYRGFYKGGISCKWKETKQEQSNG